MNDLMEKRCDEAFAMYPCARASDQDGAVVRHPVIVVGGGPVGLAMALDLGLKGARVVLPDDHEGAGLGSRAICFAKRTLEICDRLGAAEAMLAKGVLWNTGKVFHDDRLLYDFNLSPEGGHAYPAFINLQQPWFEKFLHDAIVRAVAGGAPIEIRGRNRVDVVTPIGDHVGLEVMTPDGGPTGLRRSGWRPVTARALRCGPCWGWISRAGCLRTTF